MAGQMTEAEFEAWVTPYIEAATVLAHSRLDLRGVQSLALRHDVEDTWNRIPSSVRLDVTARAPLKVSDDPYSIFAIKGAYGTAAPSNTDNIIWLSRELENHTPTVRARVVAHEVAHCYLQHGHVDAATRARYEDAANALAASWIPKMILIRGRPVNEADIMADFMRGYR